MKKVAIYARVSTIDKGQNLDTQILPLKEYAERRGWEIYRIYCDQMSGSKESRPALNELMLNAHQRKFDVVLCFRFDRMGRSTKMMVDTLKKFKDWGISFVSYQEQIDTSSIIGETIYTIISAFAQLERSIIQERVVSGLNRVRNEGKVLGRKKPILINRIYLN
uniref:Recombinase family protein n=1 Tax=candidate division CPR3 bacterium TaxID=2268181 RepID=A0A7C4M3G9_UNCC3